MYKYQLDMYREPKGEEPYWEKECVRYYMVEKNLDDFDLCEVPGKRINVKFLGKI